MSVVVIQSIARKITATKVLDMEKMLASTASTALDHASEDFS